MPMDQKETQAYQGHVTADKDETLESGERNKGIAFNDAGTNEFPFRRQQNFICTFQCN